MFICTGCGVKKETSAFHTNKTMRGHAARCKDCLKSVRWLGKRALLEEGEWELLFEFQGRKCAGCNSSEPGYSWILDHDHSCDCGRRYGCRKCVRGILCFFCNLALGQVQDNKVSLSRMVDYLESAK